MLLPSSGTFLVIIAIVLVQYSSDSSTVHAASISAERLDRSRSNNSDSNNTVTIVTPSSIATTPLSATGNITSDVIEEFKRPLLNTSRKSRAQDFNNEVEDTFEEEEEDEFENDIESDDVEEDVDDDEEELNSVDEYVVEAVKTPQPVVQKFVPNPVQESTRETKKRHGGGGLGGKRKRKGGKKKKDSMFKKFMPMMIIPFMIQSAMLPMVLATIKMMLLKTLLVGKLALILIGINALRRNDVDTSYSTRRVQKTADLAMAHYGYNGDEEYGAYVNKRSGYRR